MDNRIVVNNEKTNLLELEAHVSFGGCGKTECFP